MKSHKTIPTPLARHIQDFFEKYLTTLRNASRHTVLAYRDTFRLFLRNAAERTGVEIDQLDHSILEIDSVGSFLEHLEKERGCGPRTRNQRLAAIKSFARYLASVAPEHLERCRRIRDIAIAHFERPEVEYLTLDEVTRLLTAAEEPRDQALLLLLYNSGGRVQEVVDLDLCDLQTDPVALVSFNGKGRRQRTCPLWDRTLEAVDRWLDERGHGKGPLFLNRQGQRLTRSGVAYILRRLVEKAQLEPQHAKRVTPHVIRHTTAMHLLQADVDITTIAAWLGHARLDTTHAYVEIDLRMKQQAIAAMELPPQLAGGTFPEGRLLAWLTALGKTSNYAQPPPPKPLFGRAQI